MLGHEVDDALAVTDQDRVLEHDDAGGPGAADLLQGGVQLLAVGRAHYSTSILSAWAAASQARARLGRSYFASGPRKARHKTRAHRVVARDEHNGDGRRRLLRRASRRADAARITSTLRRTRSLARSRILFAAVPVLDHQIVTFDPAVPVQRRPDGIDAPRARLGVSGRQ